MDLLQAITQLSMSGLSSQEGDKLLVEKKYDQAKEAYWNIAKGIAGAKQYIPLPAGAGGGGVRNQVYTNLGPFERANLMSCYNGLAKCCIQEDDIENALVWLEEVNVLYLNTYYQSDKPLYDWIDLSLDLPELTQQRVACLTTASDLFLKLGNTGTAVYRRWVASTSVVNMPPRHRSPAVQKMNDMNKITDIVQLRHPDPSLSAKIVLTVPSLQLRGSWAKFPVKAGGRISARFGFTSFIWKSRLYVAGGRKDSMGPFFRDLWYLDLTPLGEWKQLPDYPIPMNRSGAFLNWNMLVNDGKAYLFTGRPQLDCFDLVTEKWGSVLTTYTATPEDVRAGVKGGWPYPGQILSDATMQFANNKMYVFGGMHRTTNIGCNLFMELDMSTKKWRRLTGYVMPPPDGDYTCPGPRKTASSWVSKGEDRFFLVFGQCDRSGASLNGEPHGASESFAFNDFWSWDIKGSKWRREKFVGNGPCARSEVACTYNKKLDKVIVFGGYTPAIPTFFITQGEQYSYSYFADTYVYETPAQESSTSLVAPTLGAPDSVPQPSAIPLPKWRQVLTRGFPTYRCQAELSTDPNTGKTYLFGGFTNTDFVPSRKTCISRSFGDVWQLKLDVPGGDYEGIDQEEEARTAKAGPWQRCFSCGSAGPWRKCGGSCNGRAFFCDGECLKQGWKEHKGMHKCKKRA